MGVYLPPPPIQVADAARPDIPRSTRWTRWIAWGLVIMLTAALAGSLVEGRRFRNQRDRQIAEVARWRAKSESWSARASTYQQRADVYQTQLGDLKNRIATTVGDLDNPTFVTWNTPAVLSGGGFLVGSVPDTFTFEAEIRSTAPITLSIMTATDFACWYSHVCAWRSTYWGPSRHIHAVFHGAEGCAVYVAVITGSGLVVPKVSAIRHPAHHPTGSCR